MYKRQDYHAPVNKDDDSTVDAFAVAVTMVPLALAVCTAVRAPPVLVARDCGRVSRDNAPVEPHGRSVIADFGLRGGCGCRAAVAQPQTISYRVRQSRYTFERFRFQMQTKKTRLEEAEGYRAFSTFITAYIRVRAAVMNQGCKSGL